MEALKSAGGIFHGLEIAFHHIDSDWRDPGPLADLLDHRRAWIVICASEGGLFEYGHDRDILSNLKALHGHPSDRLRVAGTIFRDIETVDPTLPAMADMTGGGLRFLGVQGLEHLLEPTGWRLDLIMEKNPVYVVFTLKKKL